MDNKEYNDYVKQITPVNNIVADVIKAFLGGGIICLLGQFIHYFFKDYLSLEEEMASSFTSIVLIALAIFLTGLGLFSKIVKAIGAGALVPICGFANSVAACAIEYKKEGHIFGTGCKIFIIAGPVILFGVFTSWVLGLIYWIGGLIGWL